MMKQKPLVAAIRAALVARFLFLLGTASMLLAGCGNEPRLVATKPDPFEAHVLPECTQACTCAASPSVITTDPYSAPNAAVREHDLRKVCVAQCEVRRKACADALDRAQHAGAIK